jgi:nucleotide-binding universal stress UspA family protein
MWQIKAILVPVDLTSPENALNTYSFATSLAEEFSADFYVLYVYQIPTFIDLLSAPFTFLKSKEEIAEIARNKAQENLSRFLDKNPTPTRNSKGLIRAGIAYEEILRVTKELKIDLIVIGTRALKGIDHLLLGSTAERVVRMASCPVISIKPKNFGFTIG